MKTQQLRKLIREIILSENSPTQPETPPTQPKTKPTQIQGQINTQLIQDLLGKKEFNQMKFSEAINSIKSNQPLSVGANKILADIMVALIKTDKNDLINSIFSNIKQIKNI